MPPKGEPSERTPFSGGGTACRRCDGVQPRRRRQRVGLFAEGLVLRIWSDSLWGLMLGTCWRHWTPGLSKICSRSYCDFGDPLINLTSALQMSLAPNRRMYRLPSKTPRPFSRSRRAEPSSAPVQLPIDKMLASLWSLLAAFRRSALLKDDEMLDEDEVEDDRTSRYV